MNNIAGVADGLAQGFAVMSNHVHVIVKMDRTAAMTRDAVEVVRRWLSIYAPNYLSDGTPALSSDDILAHIAMNKMQVDAMEINYSNSKDVSSWSLDEIERVRFYHD